MNVDNPEINCRIEEKHRLVPGKSALLVIDMQHGFLDEGASLEVAAGRARMAARNEELQRCIDRRVLAADLAVVRVVARTLRRPSFKIDVIAAAAGQVRVLRG